MNRHLYILGAGGLAKELGSYIKYINSDFMLSGFFDDAKTGSIGDLGQVLGKTEKVSDLDSGNNLLMGVGLPSQKTQILTHIQKPDKYNFPFFIQSNVNIADKRTIKIGKGSVIAAGSSLTTSIHIGDHVLINLNCTIGHDVQIGDFSSIMPGANISGNVTIGKEVLIGAGATILQGVKIGDGAIVGAGAVVTKDVLSGNTVVGIPAGEVPSLGLSDRPVRPQRSAGGSGTKAGG